MIKAAYTAQELADMKLSGWPQTPQGITKAAKKQGWDSKEREGSGGGREFPFEALPEALRIAIVEALGETGRRADVDMPPAAAADKSRRRIEARLIILQHLEHYRVEKNLGADAAIGSFSRLYNSSALTSLPGWIMDIFPRVSDRTLWRWRVARQQDRFAALGKSQNNRAGTGVLDRAEDGAVAEYLAALIVKQPHLTSMHLRDLCVEKFGAVIRGSHAKTGKAFEAAMPDLRTFRRWSADWREVNADVLAKIVNPDGHKNRFQIAIGKADAGVEALNQLWEIDASPADVLCVDGRYSIYAIIDVWSRRTMFLVSRTAKSEASLRLIRKAIIAWGVPQVLRTDNGSDFKSHRFMSSLLPLDIEQQLCRPFTPESKPFVERCIRTLQHGLMPLLDGYVGHSVKDRKQIEGRKSFAQRLGEEEADLLQVKLTAEQLQGRIDSWAADKYAHTPHAGLDGMTPFARAASSTDAVRKIENIRALDMLLSPIAEGGGFRVIGKKGLRIEGAWFYGAGLEVRVGERVMVRLDDENMGRVYVFNEDSEFICEAVNYERDGASRIKAATMAKANQREFLADETRKLKADARKFFPAGKMAEDYLSNAARNASKVSAFPKQTEVYSTPALEEAARAADAMPASEGVAIFAQHQKPAAKAPTALQDVERRWQRACRLIAEENAGTVLRSDDADWLNNYKTSREFKSRKDFEGMKEAMTESV